MIKFCLSRLVIDNPFGQVYAGSAYCGTVKYTAGETKFKIQCDGLVADHVTIRQPYNMLTLCEVRVYGKRSEDGNY